MDSRNEHPTAAALEGYRERALSPAEYLEVGGHISGCPECQAQVADPRDLQAALSLSGLDVAREREHLTYEQLDALDDNSLSLTERRPLSRHVERCDSCRLQLDELHAFKAELAATEPVPEPVQPWWSVVVALIARPGFLAPVSGLVAAGLASLAIFGLVVSPLRNREYSVSRKFLTLAKDLSDQRDQTRSELARTQGERDEMQAQVGKLQEQIGTLQGQGKAAAAAQQQELASAKLELETAKTHAADLERQLAAPSSRVLAFRDGGQLKVASLGGEPVVPLGQSEAETLRSGQLALNVAPDLSGPAGLPRGIRPTVAIESPVATAVQSATPTLRWSDTTKADGYEVRLTDLGTQKTEHSRRIRAKEWKVPEALKDGHRYEWEVTAFHGAEEIPQKPARFQVLSAPQREQVTQELKKAGPSHFAQGLVFARDGLREDAHREFELLLKENPGSAPVQKLLDRTQPSRPSP